VILCCANWRLFPELLGNVEFVTTYISRGYQPAHAQINLSANSETYYWMSAAGILQPLFGTTTALYLLCRRVLTGCIFNFSYFSGIRAAYVRSDWNKNNNMNCRKTSPIFLPHIFNYEWGNWNQTSRSIDHLCGLVVRVPGYRSEARGSIPGTTRFSEK
jgi:hypothetical protein